MKPALVPLSPEHFGAVVYRPDHARYIQDLGEWGPNIESSLLKNGGVTLILGDEVLAMAGIGQFWDGVGQLWMRTGIRAHEYPIAVVKAARAYLRTVDAVLSLRRIQAHVKADSAINRRYIESLGFHPEGTMRAFGPDGSDYILYARVAT